MTTQIGLAALFHSDRATASRLDANSRLQQTVLPAQWAHDACLFRIPEHLRQQWWNNAAADMLEGGAGRDAEGFRKFVEAFRAFAEFKHVPLDARAEFDVLLRADGSPKPAPAAHLALVNLGDENTFVTLAGERVLLEPDDGCWSQEGALALDEAAGQSELEVLLAVRAK